MKPDYDVLIIGSGFGGSVSALRLTEKGYRVGVLEAGRRFSDEEFAKTSWDLRKFLWAPQAGLLRHPAHPPAAQRDDPGRRRRGRRIAELRQHAVRAAGAVLRRPAVVAHHRLACRADAALRAGAADAGRGQEPDLHRRRPHRQGGRRRDGRAATPSCRPRSGCSSVPTAPRHRARPCPTRTSAAPGRRAPAAWNAAAA